jgi:hypothetical protein
MTRHTMTLQAVADAVGVNASTVKRALDGTPAFANAKAETIGKDGKRYPATYAPRKATAISDRAGLALILAALLVAALALAGCERVVTAGTPTTTSRPACAWRMVGVSAWATDYVRDCEGQR